MPLERMNYIQREAESLLMPGFHHQLCRRRSPTALANPDEFVGDDQLTQHRRLTLLGVIHFATQWIEPLVALARRSIDDEVPELRQAKVIADIVSCVLHRNYEEWRVRLADLRKETAQLDLPLDGLLGLVGVHVCTLRSRDGNANRPRNDESPNLPDGLVDPKHVRAAEDAAANQQVAEASLAAEREPRGESIVNVHSQWNADEYFATKFATLIVDLRDLTGVSVPRPRKLFLTPQLDLLPMWVIALPCALWGAETIGSLDLPMLHILPLASVSLAMLLRLKRSFSLYRRAQDLATGIPPLVRDGEIG